MRRERSTPARLEIAMVGRGDSMAGEGIERFERQAAGAVQAVSFDEMGNPRAIVTATGLSDGLELAKGRG
jgi:hypothetical protein